MRTIAAREIKRRGISCLDEALQDGPVHVVKDDKLSYVVLNEGQYRDLLEAQEEADVVRIKAALGDVQATRVRRSTAQELVDEFGLEN